MKEWKRNGPVGPAFVWPDGGTWNRNEILGGLNLQSLDADPITAAVDLVPRLHSRGIEALPLGLTRIPPRRHRRGFLWYGVKRIILERRELQQSV